MSEHDVDVVEQGGEPQPRPRTGPPTSAPQRLRAALQRRGLGPDRLLVVGVLVAAVVGGLWYAGRPSLPASAQDVPGARAAAERTPLAPVPARPEPRQPAVLAHDLVAPPAPADDSFIASAGHLLLFVQIRNDGPVALRVVAGMVPQDGVGADLVAGGLTAGTSKGSQLRPGATTEVFVRLSVDCSVATSGDPADHFVLAVEADHGPRQYESVSFAHAGSLWDEGRHAACTALQPAEAVHVRLVPASLSGTADTTGGSGLVRGLVQLHDRAGFAAVLARSATAGLGGATRVTWAPRDGQLVVGGGATVDTFVQWRVDCRAAAAPPPAPTFAVQLPEGVTTPVATDLGTGWFPAAWAAARAQACA